VIRRPPRRRVSLAVVAGLLGLLVVAQLRGQGAISGIASLSAQQLTLLVANLSTRNDQLRSEVATLERQLGDLSSTQSRGEDALDQLRSDLRRIETWGGLVAVHGPGVTITVGGPIGGSAVEDILNELRNAGAEAIAVGGVRVVPGSVVAGLPGEISIENTPLQGTFDIDAIGSPQALAGSLTRAGGIIAQLAATQPDAELTVTPLDAIEIPAADRSLAPSHGKPLL
jgi:uncharacterized protein YlxW (UPF0749 family)